MKVTLLFRIANYSKLIEGSNSRKNLIYVLLT